MQEEIYLKYKDIKMRLKQCNDNGIIKKRDFEEINSELVLLFPYVNYYSLHEVKINYKLLDNKLDILDKKLKNIVLKKYKG